jgi:hypothetical protein
LFNKSLYKRNEMTDQQDLPPPSELGTKEYWDNQYETEKKFFDEVGDKGEVWYGETAMNRMVRWIKKNIGQAHHMFSRFSDPESTKFRLFCFSTR